MATLDTITDVRLRRRVVDLFTDAQRRIDEEGVDLVILCARRLACLYQALVRSGHPPLHDALVVSDRFLESDCDWQWTNVLIMDDSIVLGTTLTALHEQVVDAVKKAGGGNVRSAAICIDREKKADFLLQRLDLLDGAIELSTDEMQEFSTDVVTTLFRNGVPFFSDFPITRELRTDIDAFLASLRTTAWHVADVTAPVVSTELHTAYVQIPTPQTAHDVLSRMPTEVSRLVESFKLRTYLNRASTEQKTATVSFVPLALLSACSVAELDEAIKSITDSTCQDQETTDALIRWPSESKHRLVQLYASAAVLHATAGPFLEEHTDAGAPEAWLDATAVALYFGSGRDAILNSFVELGRWIDRHPPGSMVVPRRQRPNLPRPSELLDDDELRSVLWQQRELMSTVREEDVPDVGQMTKVGALVAHAISSVFGFVSSEFEEPQQQDIRELGEYDRYMDLYLVDPRRRVLNQTLTMRELAAALLEEPDQPSNWARALVSLGVDIGNDLGIVVPTTQVDPVRGLVYRAYRLGETAGLARTPLSQWEPDDGEEALDEVMRWFLNARGASPLRSTNVSISLPEASVGGSTTIVDLDQLRAWRRKGLPGRVVGCYEGAVVSVDDGGETFLVDLVDILTHDETQARLGITQLPSTQVGWVRPGVKLKWTIFESETEGFKDRTGRVRLVESQVVDAAAREAAIEEYSFLASAE